MAEFGITGFIELGPGGVLTGMTKRTVDNARSISVATIDDLDKLIEWVGQFSPASATLTPTHEGEHLFAVERLVVSPAAGIFSRSPNIADGASIVVGQSIGTIGDTEVRSPFAGVVQSFIAVDGERVTAHQPIAWLRSH
jgi:[acyl-carrier-protein] S-malonyltransferase